jgi:hypothetical protein
MTTHVIEHIDIDQLQPAARNPKRHDLPAIASSLRRFGFVAPLVLDDRTGRLVAGHGRLEALRVMRDQGQAPPARIVANGNQWLVPVVRGIAFADEREAEGYLLADNRLVELGRWNDGELAKLLAEQNDLNGLGWAQGELQALLTVPSFEPDASGDKPMDVITFQPPELAGDHDGALLNAMHLSITDEHPTPPEIVEAARHVLGTIDLDPCSTAEFNETVQATTFYTKDDDGLIQPWAGAVFLNPPGDPLGKLPKEFWAKLISEWTAGSVTKGIYIGFNLDQLRSLQNAGVKSPLHFPICVPRERLKFRGDHPTHGNFISLVSEDDEDVEMFWQVFGEFGDCR